MCRLYVNAHTNISDAPWLCLAIMYQIYPTFCIDNTNGSTTCPSGECRISNMSTNFTTTTMQTCPNHCNCSYNGSCQSCNNGFFGPKCQKNCSNCDGLYSTSACHMVTGRCEKCHWKFYGDMCNMSCPSGCNKGESCNRYNGSCVECKDIFKGEFCNISVCGDNCERCMYTGMCSECNTNYFVTNGSCEKCPEHCITCIDSDTCLKCKNGQCGHHCNESCSNNCNDGSCTSDMTGSQINITETATIGNKGTKLWKLKVKHFHMFT